MEGKVVGSNSKPIGYACNLLIKRKKKRVRLWVQNSLDL